jgi:epoxide hydrolase-like predicted phosphatase
VTIDAVLWDFGGIFTPSPFGALHAYAEAEGVDPAELSDLLFGPYDADTDHAWHRLERGELSFVDALQEIMAEAKARGVPLDLGAVFTAMVGSDDRSAVVETVRTVRARGVRTAIVTNNIREYGDMWRTLVPVDELFDVVVDSSEEGVRKPDPQIFLLTLDRLGVSDPARVVFLDDFDGNVAAARALGMHTILVGADPHPAMAELLALLGP